MKRGKKEEIILRFDSGVPWEEIRSAVLDFLRFHAVRSRKRGMYLPVLVNLSHHTKPFWDLPLMWGFEFRVYELSLVTVWHGHSMCIKVDAEEFFIKNEKRFEMLADDIKVLID